jgi:hypothetical protein
VSQTMVPNHKRDITVFAVVVNGKNSRSRKAMPVTKCRVGFAHRRRPLSEQNSKQPPQTGTARADRGGRSPPYEARVFHLSTVKDNDGN